MNDKDLEIYNSIRNENAAAFYRQKRGLIEVSGKEAIQFLNGLITNDVAKLETFCWMSAAFPNVQGRLLAKVRVLRFDESFIFETEEATHEKVFQNLFRFTFAGDFKVEDVSDKFSYFSVRGENLSEFGYKVPTDDGIIGLFFGEEFGFSISAFRESGFDVFVPIESADEFLGKLKNQNAVEISNELYEVLRIENGVPLYDVDMDETTVVLETGIDEAVSFTKGCYIGQEIIARIHFRGHVAKQLTGLIFESENANVNPGDEIKSLEDKNAGKITSVTFSPKLNKTIALAFVRYDFLAENTDLKIGDLTAKVKNLPF